MKENIEELKQKFETIKNKELNKNLRNGPTGIGYTFEKLIGKEEDREILPDYKGIEIKTKLGFSKSPMTLFSLVPTKDDELAIPYILNKFGYPDKKSEFKNFRGSVFYKQNNIIANKYIFKIKIDKENNRLKLIILNTYLDIIDDTIYWDLNKIKERLITKLNYLAIVKGYPYKRKGLTYYKYTNLTIYKLKGFDNFLEMLKNDKIFISFNIGVYLTEERYGRIKDRGTAFRINIQNISDLFEKIN